MKRLIVITLLVALAITLTACTSTVVEVEKEFNGPIFMSENSRIATGQVYYITIEHNAVSIPSLNIKKGDTVEWVNKDVKSHTIVLNNGAIDDKLPPGGVARYTFLDRGMFGYTSLYDPHFRGIISVE